MLIICGGSNESRLIESCDINIPCSLIVVVGKSVNVTKKMKERSGQFFTQSRKTLVSYDDTSTSIDSSLFHSVTKTFSI
jgi:hypothetical protein